ncbi:hypothetical protein METP3_00409 [Methanosarcinales archaeon]|nr:hypothetical protein METP3_00409 [Methanosarcinales archaeon]
MSNESMNLNLRFAAMLQMSGLQIQEQVVLINEI